LLPDGAAAISSSTAYELFSTWFSIFADSISVAGVVRVGNALGANDPKRARGAALLVLSLSFLSGIVGFIFMGSLSKFYVDNFMDDESVRRYFNYCILSLFIASLIVIFRIAYILILVAAPFQIFTSIFKTTLAILQGCGLQLLGAKLAILAYAFIGLPLGLFLAFKTGSGIIGLWVGVLFGASIVSLGGLVWVWRADWEKLSSDAQKRLEEKKFHHPEEVPTESNYA